MKEFFNVNNGLGMGLAWFNLWENDSILTLILVILTNNARCSDAQSFFKDT